MGPTDAASVRHSLSTWQQPCPAPASAGGTQGPGAGEFMCFVGRGRAIVDDMNVTGTNTTATARATSSPAAAA